MELEMTDLWMKPSPMVELVTFASRSLEGKEAGLGVDGGAGGGLVEGDLEVSGLLQLRLAS